MVVALLTALTLANTYPRAMEIAEIDTARDMAICVDAVGFEWEFSEPEDFEVGDLVICTMYDNGTKENIFDDEITDVIWSGYRRETMDISKELAFVLEGMAKAESEKVTDVVRTRTKGYVLVDTCYTIDHGYETMVFKCDSEGNVPRYDDLDCDRYDTWEDAKKGHERIRSEWAER